MPQRALVVGKKAWDADFLKLAAEIDLDRKIRDGLNLLVFEQPDSASPFGLRLQERSTRDVFLTTRSYALLKGLAAADFHDLRGQSDLIEPYPAAVKTPAGWSFPKRFYKWSNRGVAATFVYTKPHYGPFLPILECGFDLVESPLLDASIGKARVVLCQMDVTSRYGRDPASTRLVDNLLDEVSRTGGESAPCGCVGDSAKKFLSQFGVVAEAFNPATSRLLAVGADKLEAGQLDAIRAAARRGAMVLLLPGFSDRAAVGLEVKDAHFFIARIASHPLLNPSDADVYLKSWTTLPAAQPAGDWEVIASRAC